MSRLLQTPDNPAFTLLRLSLGVVFFAHGAQKALGWFGGFGFAGTMQMFTHGMGIPGPLAALAIAAEFLGGIGLILGFLTRIAAFGILVDMLVALFKVHLNNGLFMNWTGAQRGEGFEFHILAIAMLLAVLARGAGAWSVDRLIAGPGPRPVPAARSEL
jgi:putative oxidoreductase